MQMPITELAKTSPEDENDTRLSILKCGNLLGHHWKFSLGLKHPMKLESPSGECDSDPPQWWWWIGTDGRPMRIDVDEENWTTKGRVIISFAGPLM